MKRTAFLFVTLAMVLSAATAMAAGSYFKVVTRDVETAVSDALAPDVWIGRLGIISTMLIGVVGAVFAGLKSIGIGRQLDALRQAGDAQHDAASTQHDDTEQRLDRIETQMSELIAKFDQHLGDGAHG